MNIPELKWVIENKHLLNDEDVNALESFDLFNQYENGQLEHNYVDMLEVLSLVGYIHKKYNSNTGGF